MGKNISVNQVKNAISLANSVGISCKIFLIHGFPGETIATTRETIALLRELRLTVNRVSLFRFVPLPGSQVFNNPTMFKLKNTGALQDWNNLHIYRNNHHWWGSPTDFKEMSTAYEMLNEFIAENWP